MKSALFLLLLWPMLATAQTEQLTSPLPAMTLGRDPALSELASVASELPCVSTDAACVEQLTVRAVKASLEIKVIDETLALARRRGWTDYISTNALNPVTMTLQLARNIAGGGDVQQRRVAIKTLQLRRAETVQSLREKIVEYVTAHASAQTKAARLGRTLEAHHIRVALLEINYRSGDGETSAMLSEWQTAATLRDEIADTQRASDEARRRLAALLDERAR